jgi:DNA-binding transcriptional ArsR family regulator
MLTTLSGVRAKTVEAEEERLSPDMLGRVAQVLKLLAHPQRLQVIEFLERRGEAPVHEIQERIDLPQAATSHHLNLMKRVGIVASERAGKEMLYHIADRRSISILHCIRNQRDPAQRTG